MSGLYTVLFGENPICDVLLFTLGYTRDDCGRFRDCYIDNCCIVIYTRNGGGNREDYEDVFYMMSKHPCFLHESDDDFDCTYASIVFSFPKQFEDELISLAVGNTDVSPSEKWKKLISDLEYLKSS